MTDERRNEGFEKAIEGVINAFSRENGSDTPDFLLASYLRACLDAWDKHVTWREDWYGRGPKYAPEPIGLPEPPK